MSQDKFRQIPYVKVSEEYVALTKDFVAGAILGYFIGWQKHVKHIDRYFAEETKRLNKFSDEPYDPESDHIKAPSGWVYKSTEQIQKGCFLNNQHKTTTAKIVDSLVESGWLMRRRNPKIKYDRTYQYRVDLVKVKKDLSEIGYDLQGWTELKEYEPKETNNDTGGSKPITSEVQKTLHACSEKPHMHMRETLLHKSENATTIPIDLRQQIQENNNTRARQTIVEDPIRTDLDVVVCSFFSLLGLSRGKVKEILATYPIETIKNSVESCKQYMAEKDVKVPAALFEKALAEGFKPKAPNKPVAARPNHGAYRMLNDVLKEQEDMRNARRLQDAIASLSAQPNHAVMTAIPLSANNQLT